MTGDAVWLGADGPERLVASLRERGYAVVAPRVEEGELVLGEVDASDLGPTGFYDEAEPGRYRLRRREPDDARAAERFGFAVGAASWKRFLLPPEVRLFEVERAEGGALRFTPEPPPQARLAFVGVRPCDLAAIVVQDRVLTASGAVDEAYAARRGGVFLAVVECGRANATCFCASMGSGPAAEDGFDVALSEILDADRHGYVGRAGSERGRQVLESLGGRAASEEELDARARRLEAATQSMTRAVDGPAVRAALAEGAELPLWQDVGARCLSCANCTLVCPTCFCTTVRDTTDLDGARAERWRSWDSCFGLEFSVIHGGSVRASPAARYRHWITHKLAGWHEQFGESGCVGCGRCIAWCPVGIDITAEAATAVAQAAGVPDARARSGGSR